MRPMIHRRALACAIAFAFSCLLRAEPVVRTAGPPSEGEHRHREHLRSNFQVGHTVMRLVVPGPAGQPRQVDVHLWYPADVRDHAHAPATEYTSALNGVLLEPMPWDPLSWKVESLSAREDPPIFRSTRKYPVIVFSHGNTNMPVDYAFTLEDLAAAGFVVAAPTHVNNSEDDVRMDYVNVQAEKVDLLPVFTCLDGAPWFADLPCAHTNVRLSLTDRVRDITHTLNALGDLLENQVDLDRVGVFGHSRGTVTALMAAGGSTEISDWKIGRESRVKAIMGMAIGAPAITFNADISQITQPTLLVSGSLDTTSPPSVSQRALDLLATPRNEKAHVTIEHAMHRTFDSTLCAQLQSAAAIAQANGRALLDSHTASGILIHPSSGVAMDYCGFDTFIRPTDVRPFVTAVTGFDVEKANVPRTGLTSDDVRACVSEMAITFFEHNLGEDHTHREDDEHQKVEERCRGLIAAEMVGQ